MLVHATGPPEFVPALYTPLLALQPTQLPAARLPLAWVPVSIVSDRTVAPSSSRSIGLNIWLAGAGAANRSANGTPSRRTKPRAEPSRTRALLPKPEIQATYASPVALLIPAALASALHCAS